MENNIYTSDVYSVVPSYVPVFGGFYGGLFDPRENDLLMEDTLNAYNEMFGENAQNTDDLDDSKLDYNGFFINTSKNILDVVREFIIDVLNVSESDIVMKFDGLYKPRSYNFGNDVINCTYYISANFVDTVLNYLNIEEGAFKAYLKDNFESREGFISNFTTDFDWWIESFKLFKTPKFTELDWFSTVLGSVLDFVLKNENIGDYEIYETVVSNNGLEIPFVQ